jgi:hypothetical protein
VTVSSRSFTFVSCYLMSLSFYHLAYLSILWLILLFCFVIYFTPSTKNFCRFECRNVVCRNFIVVFWNISSSFSALVFTIKLPNLLNIHYHQFLMNFNFIHKVSTVAWTSPFQDLIFLKFCYDICFRHFLSLFIIL